MMSDLTKAIVKREILTMWRDKSLRNILLFVPLLSLLLFAGIYSSQRISSITTAVVDLDKTKSSAQVMEALNNSPDLQIIAYPENYEQLKAMIQNGQTVVGVVIPEGYGKNLALHRQTKIAVFIDGMSIAYATNASTAVLTVTRTLGAKAGISTLVAKGIQPNQALEAYQSVDFREEAWFNPTLNYAYFLVLAFALNMWQQCCTLAACMNIIGENGRRSWMQIRSSGVSALRLFATKSLVHLVVFIATVLPVYFIAFQIWHLPLAGGWAQLLLFTLVFSIALHGLGTLMSCLSGNAVNASRYGMIVALPSFVISGFTWPLETMPHWLQTLAWILPQTWFFQGINYLTFKNPDWAFMKHYMLVLALMAVLFYGAAALLWRVLKGYKGKGGLT